MGPHMKTTVEISDALLEEAKKVMKNRGVTLRALIEEGLRHRLADEQQPRSFRLRRVTFTGRGLRPEIREGSWESIRQQIYEGRGG